MKACSRRLRILIVSHYFEPEEFRINDLAHELSRRGHVVTVLTGQPNYPNGRRFPGHGRLGPWRQRLGDVLVLRVPVVTRGGGRLWRLALNFLSAAASASLLGPTRVRGPIDVILVYQPSPVTVGLPAVVLKAVKRAPIVLWVQDLWPETLEATGAVRSSMVLGLVGAFVRWFYRQSHLILAESEAFIPSMISRGARPERVRYFPNWAEELYRPMTLTPDAPEHQELPNGFRVVFAGNIGYSQSLETVLAAAERLRDATDIHWVILGDGRKRAWVEGEVRRRGLGATVHLLGRRSVEDMPRFFSLADVLLLTLRRHPTYALTLPSKLQSYLACGRPVLAAIDGEGARVVAEAKAGVVCPAEDAAALADATMQLYRMPAARRAHLGINARAYFETNYQRKDLIDRLEGWMKELARNPSCV